jgi:hypothetical protein
VIVTALSVVAAYTIRLCLGARDAA